MTSLFHRAYEGRQNESNLRQDRVAYLYSLLGSRKYESFEYHGFCPVPSSPRTGELSKSYCDVPTSRDLSRGTADRAERLQQRRIESSNQWIQRSGHRDRRQAVRVSEAQHDRPDLAHPQTVTWLYLPGSVCAHFSRIMFLSDVKSMNASRVHSGPRGWFTTLDSQMAPELPLLVNWQSPVWRS